MKRPSISFNKEAIVDFLLRHGEKFLVAVIGLSALGLAWGGIDAVRSKSASTQQRPETILRQAGDAAQHIEREKTAPASEKWSGRPLATAIDPWRNPTVADPPQLALLDRPLFEEFAKRTQPDVFPIEDLRAVAGLAVLGDGTDGAEGKGPRTQIVPYVIVTGLIPADKQYAEFTRSFGSAGHQNPETDSPIWSTYRVERMAVKAGTPGRWDVVNAMKNPPGLQEPAARAGDIPSSFLLTDKESDVSFVASLPPRRDAAWGTAAFHPSILPMLQTAQINPQASEMVIPLKDLNNFPERYEGQTGFIENVWLGGEPRREKDAAVFLVDVRSKDGVRVLGMSDVGRSEKLVFAVSEKFGSDLSLKNRADAEYGCNLRIRVDRMGKTRVARILRIDELYENGKVAESFDEPNPEPIQTIVGSEPTPSPTPSTDKAAAKRMFRFLDTSVKPGEEYRYRVRIALKNPNHGILPQHLSDSSYSKSPFLVSKESNETAAVSVPDPTAVLVGPLRKAEMKKMKTGMLEVLVLAPSSRTGDYALRGLVTEPGGLLNVDEKLNKPGDKRTRGEDIRTDRVLVDVRGRQEDRTEQRSTRPPEPFEVLCLRPDGGFEFVSAADAEPVIAEHKATLPADDGGKGPAKPGQPDAAPSPFGSPF